MPSAPPAAADAMIRTRGVRVDYDDVTAVHDLNLEIGAGEVYGLIGPNGAGKTSAIRVLATLQEPTYGDVEIAGFDTAIRTSDARSVLGYMPDMPPVFGRLRCWEMLDLFGAAHGMPRRERRARVEECLDLVNLKGKRNAMAGTLSRGMQQRLVLAKTVLPGPRVLLLDEPASGLDPIARIELRDLLKRLASEGRTVLISSHILTELSAFCTSIGIMEKGNLVLSGRLDDIIGGLNVHRRIVVELIGEQDGHAGWLREQTHVVEVLAETAGRLDVAFAGEEADAAELLRALVTRGAAVRSFYETRLDVEDILLKVGAREVS